MKKTILSAFLFILACSSALFITSCSKDETAPVITVNGGDQTISLQETYIDLEAVATDDKDGSVTVTSDESASNPNINLKGVYTITYTASDKEGNTATASRTVTVVNDADFLGGSYVNAKDTCAGTPASFFDATVTPSNTKNNVFTVLNFGAFGSSVSVSCKLSGSVITAESTPQSLGGTASLTTIYSAGSLVVSESSPTVFTVSYRWEDGASSDNCNSTYTK